MKCQRYTNKQSRKIAQSRNEMTHVVVFLGQLLNHCYHSCHLLSELAGRVESLTEYNAKEEAIRIARIEQWATKNGQPRNVSIMNEIGCDGTLNERD